MIILRLKTLLMNKIKSHVVVQDVITSNPAGLISNLYTFIKQMYYRVNMKI